MANYSCNAVIDLNIKKTYEIAETYPLFISFYKHKEIVCSTPEMQKVKISSSFLGFSFSWEGEGVKEKYNKIVWIQSKGLLKGLRAEWNFLDQGPERTLVTLSVTYNNSISFWSDLAKIIFIKPTIPKILQSLKVACDGNI